MRRILMTIFLGIVAFTQLTAQTGRFSISTDILGYARLGTMNLETSYAVSRKWSITAGARYNPFTFHKGDPERQFHYRQQSYSVGARVWPWHIWSGWWFSGKLRYQEYNYGGVVSDKTEEGDRFGFGLYSGYTHMLTSNINLEFGFGMWNGLDIYTAYSCPSCGFTTDHGNRYFLLPDDVMISLVYVF